MGESRSTPWLTANVSIICSHKGILDLVRFYVGYCRFTYHANEIIENLCKKPVINKTRHYVTHGNHTWEIDEFHNENQGLIVAEIELTTLDEEFTKPNWIGNEVTNDLRYYNNNLANNPYSEWTKDMS